MLPCPKPTSAWHAGHCRLHVFKLCPCLVRLPQNCKLVVNLVQSFAPGFAPSFAPKKNKAWKEVAGHPPLFARAADLAGAAQAQEEHLLLQRNAAAVGQHHTTFKLARFRMSVYGWSQNVTRYVPSTSPSMACWPGSAGKEETAALAAAQVEAWLEGLLSPLALAGPAGDLKNALSVAVSGAMLPTVSDVSRSQQQAWKEVALYSPFSAVNLCRAGGSGTGGAPAAAAERLRCWTASPYICALAHACLYVVSKCAPTRYVPSTSLSLAGWRAGVRGKEVLELLPQSPALEATQTSQVLSGWTETTWPASLGWPSGPAGATLEGRLACFARRARGPSRCHADRLPGLRLSAGLMAHPTPIPGLLCPAAPLAQSALKYTHSPPQSLTHWPLDVRPSYARSL